MKYDNFFLLQMYTITESLTCCTKSRPKQRGTLQIPGRHSESLTRRRQNSRFQPVDKQLQPETRRQR